MKNELLEPGKLIINSQPFTQFIGAELISLEKGSAEIGLAMNDKHKQQHGFIHGRVISYLADNCLTFAGGSMLGDSVTLEFKINYIKPGLGNTLTARASVLSSGRKNAVCECRIYAGYEALIAVTQGTIVKV